MPDSAEQYDDLFSVEDTNPFPKEEVKSKNIPPILELPKNKGRFSPTAQAILEELRVRHRRLEMHGSSEISPSLLPTVDQIPEILQKEVQLPDTHKTQIAISEALLELSDAKNGFVGRAVYFYPFLLRSENGITIRIIMAAPQNKDKLDMTPYRRACFKYSEELVAVVYKNLANKDPIIDESKPGKILLERDTKGDLFFYPNLFSAEQDFNMITEKGFSPYVTFVIPDFTYDLIEFGKTSKRLLEINSEYHIVIPTNGFVEILLKHIAVQLDGLSNFIFQYLKKIAKENQTFRFLDIIEDLEKKTPDSSESLLNGGWKIAYEYINLIQEFPFNETLTDENFRVKESCFLSVQILKKLLDEVQKKGRDVFEDRYKDILKKVKEKVLDNSIRNLQLTPVSVELELSPLFTEPNVDKTALTTRFMNDMSAILGAYSEKNQNGEIVCYAVDQRYLNDIIENIKSVGQKDENILFQLKYLEIIHKELIRRNDPLLDSLSETNKTKAKPESTDISETEKEKDKIDWNSILENFDLPSGLGISLFGSSIATIVSLIKNEMDTLLTGVFVSVLSGIVFSYIYKKSQGTEKEKLSSKKAPIIPSNQKSMNLLKAVETVLFPKKFNHVFEKVYDTKKLRYQIEESIEEIKSFLPEGERTKDNKKLFIEIESNLPTLIATIRIPDDVQMKGKVRELIISKNDLKTIVFRDKLADHFRKEASVYKSDQDMMAYLNFIIKEIEFGYAKYIK